MGFALTHAQCRAAGYTSEEAWRPSVRYHQHIGMPRRSRIKPTQLAFRITHVPCPASNEKD